MLPVPVPQQFLVPPAPLLAGLPPASSPAQSPVFCSDLQPLVFGPAPLQPPDSVSDPQACRRLPAQPPEGSPLSLFSHLPGLPVCMFQSWFFYLFFFSLLCCLCCFYSPLLCFLSILACVQLSVLQGAVCFCDPYTIRLDFMMRKNSLF